MAPEAPDERPAKSISSVPKNILGGCERKSFVVVCLSADNPHSQANQHLLIATAAQVAGVYKH